MITLDPAVTRAFLAARGSTPVWRALTAVIVAICLGAPGCSSEDEPKTPTSGPCDPLTNTGCDEGQKCSVRIDREMPLETTVTCVPRGYVVDGGQCAFDAPGPSGHDNCVGTTLCLGGTCTPICAEEPDTCPVTESACIPYGGFFGEQELGLCAPLCEPLEGEACDTNQGCYLRLGTGKATCGQPGILGQGEVCEFINACEQGLGCVLLAPDRADTLCTAFCDPATGATASGKTWAEALSDQAVQPACAAINQFYSDTPAVPDRIGMCLDCAIPGYAALPVCSTVR